MQPEATILDSRVGRSDPPGGRGLPGSSSRDTLRAMTDREEPQVQNSADELVPVLYAELRRLARARMANLAPGNTLQPTALVHEVFVRLSQSKTRQWNGRGHFFGAAARAMRQILIDQARRKRTAIHGGDQQRLDVDDVDIAVDVPAE